MVYRNKKQQETNNAGRLGAGFITEYWETRWLGRFGGFYVLEPYCRVLSRWLDPNRHTTSEHGVSHTHVFSQTWLWLIHICKIWLVQSYFTYVSFPGHIHSDTRHLTHVTHFCMQNLTNSFKPHMYHVAFPGHIHSDTRVLTHMTPNHSYMQNLTGSVVSEVQWCLTHVSCSIPGPTGARHHSIESRYSHVFTQKPYLETIKPKI